MVKESGAIVSIKHLRERESTRRFVDTHDRNFRPIVFGVSRLECRNSASWLTIALETSSGLPFEGSPAMLARHGVG
ncbi:hypothetical protein [Bradyrhizobium sp. AZCC 1578]|uniref:hypothetical protein n=1 Tax=Bradyrhizobium sp. AZCC 1578 TaxID=3117027 RepID=UPI002FEE8182